MIHNLHRGNTGQLWKRGGNIAKSYELHPNQNADYHVVYVTVGRE